MSKKQWESYYDALRSQDWEKALNSLNSILKKEPKNPQVHLKIGDVFQKAGDASSAVAAYHQSAWLLMNEGFLQKALAVFKIILRLDPDNAEAINKSKELMMELESSKMKAPIIPSLETKVEFETEQKVEAGPSARMEDLLERTSFSEESLVATPPAKIQEQAEAGIQIETGAEESISHIPSFLASLPENEVKQLISRLDPRSFLSGQMIVEEGDSGDSVFVIRSGRAKVVAHILGKEIELASLSVGDVFGEVAFLTGRPRTASVIATEKLEVTEFNRLLLEDIFERYPDILKKLEDFYHSHVQDTLEKVKSRIKK